MSEYFWKLPSKRLYPDYYKMIKNPISLLQIRTKIKVYNDKLCILLVNFNFLCCIEDFARILERRLWNS